MKAAKKTTLWGVFLLVIAVSSLATIGNSMARHHTLEVPVSDLALDAPCVNDPDLGLMHVSDFRVDVHAEHLLAGTFMLEINSKGAQVSVPIHLNFWLKVEPRSREIRMTQADIPEEELNAAVDYIRKNEAFKELEPGKIRADIVRQWKQISGDASLYHLYSHRVNGSIKRGLVPDMRASGDTLSIHYGLL